MTIEHSVTHSGKLHLLRYPLGERTTSIGVLAPGIHRFNYDNKPYELSIVDENGEIELVDASWGPNRGEDDCTLRGEEVVFHLKKAGEWATIKCTDYTLICIE